MKAFQIHAETRRTLTEDEQAEKEDLGPDYWPPWMETGLIRECQNCGRMDWEVISMLDECEDCFVNNFIDRRPTWWEKLVHWWKIDKKFTGKDAVALYGKEEREG